MKPLLENWKRFINEIKDVDGEEQKKNIQDLLKDEDYIKIVEKIFEKKPNLAKKVIKITSKFTDNQNLSEDSFIHEDDKVYELSSSFEDLLAMIGAVSGATTASMILGLDYVGAPHGDADTILSGLGITGATILLGFLSTKARESLEKRGVKLPKFFGSQKRLVKYKEDYDEDQKDLEEKKLNKLQKNKKEKFVKGMKSAKKDFEEKYPGRGEEVMYATATKMSKKKKKQED